MTPVIHGRATSSNVAVTRALRVFEERAAVAMEQRSGAPFLMGEGLTLADIWVGHVLCRYFTLDLDRRPPERLEAYYASLTERPAYATHVMVDYSELKGDQ